MKNMSTIFPLVKDVTHKIIADEIFTFIPGNLENMKMWDKILRDIANNVKKDFDSKGISLPEIVIDCSRVPINKDNFLK